MKTTIKLIITITIVCTLVTTLIGCSSKNEEVSDSISIIAPLNSIDEPNENSDISEKLKDLTGENINIMWIPEANYKSKSTMMIASGESPDILVVQNVTEDIVKGVDQGGFWQIDEYLNVYPNLANGDKIIQNNASFMGKTYGIYRNRNVIDNSLILRKDWLEKLELKEPKNIDEFTEVLRRFTNDDPDGNGISDTYGLGIAGADDGEFSNVVNQIAAWFGAPNEWKVQGDKLIPSFETEEYKKALDYIKKIYNEGLIDPKCYLKNNSEIENNFLNNNYGSIFEKISKADKLESSFKEKYKGIDLDKMITVISSIKVNEHSKILSTSGYSGMLMFPKKGIKNEQELKRVLGFVDKLNSKECYTLLNYGIENKNYKRENDEYKTIQDITTYDLLSFSELSTNWNKVSLVAKDKSEFEKNLNEVQNIKEQEISINPALSLKTSGYINNEKSILANLDEINAKYIFGELDKNQYESCLKDWIENEGDNYIQDVNKLYEEYLNK